MRECIKPVRVNYVANMPEMKHQPFPEMSPETLLYRLRSAPIGNMRVHPDLPHVLMWMPITESGYGIDFYFPSPLAVAVFLAMLREDIELDPKRKSNPILQLFWMP